MNRQLFLKGSIIVLTISLILISTLMTAMSVNGYRTDTARAAQTELVNGPCWRCGTG